MANCIHVMKVVTRTVLCTLVLVQLCYAEHPFFHRNHDDMKHTRPPPHVISESDCLIFLCTYEYLNCTCNAHTLRSRREATQSGARGGSAISGALDGFFPSVVELDEPKPTPPLPECSDSHKEEGYKEFQKRFGIPVTGNCDDITKSKMNSRRCGNSDTPDKKIKKSLLLQILPNAKAPPPAHSTGQGAHQRRRRHVVEEVETRRNEYMKRNIRPVVDTTEQIRARYRKKRDATTYTKKCITWRLSSAYQSTKIPVNEQRYIFHLAFRMWSEVTPLTFIEDLTSDINDVDILVAFSRNEHLNCPQPFDGGGGVLAHSVLPQGDMHYDDDETYTSSGSNSMGVYLLLVAVHEIGHVLGLSHSQISTSIMWPDYDGINRTSQFELDLVDRNAIRNLYSPCNGRFNTVFDWVRYDQDTQGLIFNSYFFRDGHYWMYENSANRTRYGDPLPVNVYWNITQPVDAYLHIWLRSPTTGLTVREEYYFFHGETMTQYDSINEKTLMTKPIGHFFNGMWTNVDSVFFDNRQSDNNVYLFKGNQVQIYNPTTGDHINTTIAAKFPPEPNMADAHKGYQSDIDSVYYSWAMNSMFFFKGEDVWKNTAYSLTSESTANQIKYVGKWNSMWLDICDVFTQCPPGTT